MDLAHAPRGLCGLLAELHAEGFSGRVEVGARGARQRVLLHRGLICGALLEDRFDPLGRILVDRGKLSRTDLARSLERMTETDRLQGQLLREMRLVSQADVEQALADQIRARVLHLLGQRVSTSWVVARDAAAARRGASAGPLIYPYALIREHAQRLGEAALRAFGATLRGKRLVVAPLTRCRPLWDQLAPREREWLRRQHGPMAVEPAGDGGVERLRLLFLLWSTNLLEAQAPPVDESSHAAGRARRPLAVSAPAALVLARRLLGVDAQADPRTLRRAFCRLALALHPDRHPGASPDEQTRLAARFAELTRAYHLLAAS